MLRRRPLRPGKPLHRGGPIQVRTRLERGPGPKRKTALKKVNPERLAWLRSIQFDLQAAICRELPCAFCGHPPPSVPHHVVRRGMGGTKGTDADTAPCCEDCHEAIHQRGDSARPVEHGALSALLHNVLMLLAPPVPENGEENPRENHDLRPAARTG